MARLQDNDRYPQPARHLPPGALARAVLAAALTVASTLAWSADLYVKPSGSDKAAGTTVDTALKTLGAAAKIVNPGDTVWVLSGTYAGFDITRPGTGAKSVTWKAYPGNHPEIPYAGRWNAIQVNASFQVIDGFTLTGNNDATTLAQAEADYSAGSGTAAVNNSAISIDNRKRAVKDFVHHLTVRNCIIRKFGGGGVGGDGDYFVFENNRFYENSWYSQYANSAATFFTKNVNFPDPSGYHNIVRNNVFWDNKGLVKWKGKPGGAGYSDGNGFILDISDADYAGRTLISGNLSVANGGSGIHSYRGRHADIVNNTAYMNGQVVGYSDIFANDSVDVRIFNNIMYSRVGGSANSNNSNTNVTYDYNVYFNGTRAVTGPHDVVADPKFKKPSADLRLNATAPAPGIDTTLADFSLQSDSPALNNGTVLASVTPTVDLTGLARPTGSGIERGAYEYKPPIVAAPVISSSLKLSGQVGTPLAYQISASGSPTAFSATGLPAGLALNNATGLIAGTPTASATSNVTVGATNAGGTGTATLVVSVAAAPPPPVSPPVLTMPTSQSARQGQPFSYQVVASGATSYGASGLPAGLAINATGGLISGTPSQAGGFLICVTAINSAATRSATFTLTVAAAGVAPTITSANTAAGVAGNPFAFQVTATPTGSSYAATGLPAGLAIDGSSGVIAGTPSVVGDSTISLTATNASGSSHATLKLHVALKADAGWQATYFNSINLTGARVSRTDSSIDFDWGDGSPATGIAVDNFSARWRATVTAPATGTWVFTTTTDDGVRLWVDGKLVIDQWVDQSSVQHTASVNFTAGQAVPVVMEYFEDRYEARARLEWQGPGTARQVVPVTATSRATDTTLPGGWTSRAIGSSGQGNASEVDGTWTLQSQGGDIWDRQDTFQFASQTLSGDGVVTACVDSLTNTDPWSKAGVMLRSGTNVDAVHASVFITPSNGVAFLRRLQSGGASTDTHGAQAAAPYCLRLTRTGNVVVALASADLSTWTEIRRDTVALGNEVLVGLAASSHSSTASVNAVFSHVSVQPAKN